MSDGNDKTQTNPGGLLPGNPSSSPGDLMASGSLGAGGLLPGGGGGSALGGVLGQIHNLNPGQQPNVGGSNDE